MKKGDWMAVFLGVFFLGIFAVMSIVKLSGNPQADFHWSAAWTVCFIGVAIIYFYVDWEEK